MLLFGAGVFGALEIAREIQQIAELALRVVLHGQQRTIAQIEAHDVPPVELMRSGQYAGSREIGTGHAMPAAAAAAEFRAAHGDHLDAGLAQQRVRVGVAVVGDDDAGLQRDDVVAVVPLFALRLARRCRRSRRRAAASDPSASWTTVEQRLLSSRRTSMPPAAIARVDAVAADLVDDLAEDRARHRGRRS